MYLVLLMTRQKDVQVNHNTNDMYQSNEVVDHNHYLTQYLLKDNQIKIFHSYPFF